MKRFPAIILVMILSSIRGAAGQSERGTAKLSIENADRSLVGKEVTIEITPFYTAGITSTFCQRIRQKITTGKMLIPIGVYGKYTYIRIWFPAPYLNILNNIFLVNKGDEMQLGLDNGKMWFAGKDADLYNCQMEMTDLPTETISPASGSVTDVLHRDFAQEAGLFDKKISVIRKYSPSISSTELVNLLDINALYTSLKNDLTMVQFHLLTTIDSLERSQIKQVFLRLLQRADSLGAPGDIAINSYAYTEFLFLKEYLQTEMTDGPYDPNRTAGFGELHAKILHTYTGAIRDRLLTILFFSTIYAGKINMVDRSAEDLPLISDEPCRILLLKRYDVLGKGKKAYSFRLQDDHDKWVSLTDFKGKVVILDFYFTGCTGCAHLTKAIGPVYEAFSENKQVVFVSVSVDRIKETFRESVKSGVYSHKGGVNLYTNGKGEDYEMVRHYGIKGYPTLLIIGKDGNIFDGDPPTPVGAIGSNSVERMKAVIEKALAEGSAGR